MSLRSQVGLLLLSLAVAFVSLTYCVQILVVMPTFTKLERHGAERDLNRFVDAIGRERDLLSHAVLDWSAWDDLYEFVDNSNERFKQATLNDESFEHAHVNLIYILDLDRKVVWGDIRDFDSNERIEAPEIASVLQAPSEHINLFTDVEDEHSGVIGTSQGPMLFAMRPIVNSEGKGPIRGAIAFGRFLNEKELKGISSRTHLNVTAWNIESGKVPSELQDELRQLPARNEKLIATEDVNTLRAYTLLNDAFGKPVVLFRANLNRDITSSGRISAYTATFCGLLAAMLTLACLWVVLHLRVVQPLMGMVMHAQKVGQSDDLKSRLNSDRRDEIGMLSNAFDEMVASLAKSRKAVLDTAHQAGMAEIASEVLHNIGNAVTSANCSIEFLEQRLNDSKAPGLKRATNMLQEQMPRIGEFFHQDPRGPKLIDYLNQLNEYLQDERTENALEAKRLKETVRHIRDVISSQQEFAKRTDFRQEVDLPTLIDEVIQLNAHAIQSAGIQTHVEFPWLPEIYVSKSKTTQVLVNLVRNAIQAMSGQPADNRHLTIKGRLVDDVDLEIEIQDTGCGFSEEVQQKLFRHGFTTKESGHGLGLHYCANVIRESGGMLNACSPGEGLGATFRIRLANVIQHQPTMMPS